MNKYMNKLILITGASGGIGGALALEFASQGALLALVGTNEQRLQSITQQCKNTGAKQVEYVIFDLNKIKKIPSLICNIEKIFNQSVDVVLHAAGTGVVGFIENIPFVELQKCITLHLMVAFALAQALLSHMRSKQFGEFIFISSGTAHTGVPTEAIYSASKAGLDRFIESLRSEVKGTNIQIYRISPGTVETKLMRTPHIFGSIVPLARPHKAKNPEIIAKKIMKNLLKNKKNVEISLKTRLLHHMKYWAPNILVMILSMQLKQATIISPQSTRKN